MQFKITPKLLQLFCLCASITLFPSLSYSIISFESASNESVSLFDTIVSDEEQVFVFQGLADEDVSEIVFNIDSDCPLVAMTGGAKFNGNWSCEGGTIAVSVTNKGGLTFGPQTDQPQGSFYVTFSNPPPAPGSDTPPAEMAGIQISIYGDIQSWNLSGEASSAGASFGVELSGPEGGAAHFLMDLPPTAVSFLGGVLGVKVGGKADPFATITTHEDGSASIAVDIASLKASSNASSRHRIAAATVTKKIVAGPRALNLAPKKTSAKAGTSITYGMCAGQSYTAGDKIPLEFVLGGQLKKSLKASFKLDAKGCDTASLKLTKGLKGTLVARIKYKGKKASANLKVQK